MTRLPETVDPTTVTLESSSLPDMIYKSRARQPLCSISFSFSSRIRLAVSLKALVSAAVFWLPHQLFHSDGRGEHIALA